MHKKAKFLFCALFAMLGIITPSQTFAQSIVSSEISEGINGSFFVNNTYSNGNYAIVMYVKCNCGGTLRCSGCGGSGYLLYDWPCMLCNGSGVCFCSKGDYPGYAISGFRVYDQHGNCIGSDSIYDNSPSYNNSSTYNTDSNTGSRSTSCYVCGGTGVDPQPCDTGRSNWIAYYNSAGTRCPHCGSTNAHRHNKCYHCNVPKH